MGIHARICLLSLALTAAGAAAQPMPAVGEDVLDLAKAIEGGKDVKGKVAAIRKKFDDLEGVMRAYKPRAKGGLGYGSAATEGIDKKLSDLVKEPLTAGRLAKEKADLLKLGYQNLALGKLAHAYTPPKPVRGKAPRLWTGYADAMEKATKDLIDAVKKGDAPGLKKAAGSISKACNDCHTDFRD